MRNAFAREITRLAEINPDLVLLSGDTGNRLFDNFKAASPNRFLNCGIAEANMISLAAGMALSGLKPVTYAIAPFTTYRCLEQIRVDLCYYNLPVVVVAVGAGLSYVGLGPTHHSCEDIAVLRAMPNLTLLCPADALETGLALEAALKIPGPVYLRLGKKGEPTVHSQPFEFVVGQARTLRQGTDVAIISTGTASHWALQAAEVLTQQHQVSAEVVHMGTLKPLDTACLEQLSQRFNLLVTLEEHSTIGGLGSALAEWLSESRNRPQLLRLGSPDRFFSETGNRSYALQQLDLTPEAISASIEKALNMSNLSD
jgi:transketolase